MPIRDDDDRAYSAAYDAGDTSGQWYPEWNGPDEGAFELWMDYLRLNGESHTCGDEPDFPSVNTEDFPFE